MKKIIIPILIVISVLIIFAISIFTIIKGENNTTIDENFNDEPSNIEDIIRHEGGEELRLAPRNINSVMNSYEGAVTQGTLEKNIYKLVVKNIPFLYNLTKTYTEEQIAELYDKNTENIC